MDPRRNDKGNYKIFEQNENENTIYWNLLDAANLTWGLNIKLKVLLIEKTESSKISIMKTLKFKRHKRGKIKAIISKKKGIEKTRAETNYV